MTFTTLIYLSLSGGPAADLLRLPGPAEARRQAGLYAAHVAWLEQAAPAWPERADDFRRWREEAAAAHDRWEALRLLWDDPWDWHGGFACFGVGHRLAWLRDRLGDEAFAAGRMPPAFPPDYQPLPFVVPSPEP